MMEAFSLFSLRLVSLNLLSPLKMGWGKMRQIALGKWKNKEMFAGKLFEKGLGQLMELEWGTQKLWMDGMDRKMRNSR
jgi:hypothetical protein